MSLGVKQFAAALFDLIQLAWKVGRWKLVIDYVGSPPDQRRGVTVEAVRLVTLYPHNIEGGDLTIEETFWHEQIHAAFNIDLLETDKKGLKTEEEAVSKLEWPFRCLDKRMKSKLAGLIAIAEVNR